MYLGLEKVEGTVGNEYLIEKLGIFCFKDGRLFLDDECISKLTTFLIETFNTFWNKTTIQNSKFFERYPAISDEDFK